MNFFTKLVIKYSHSARAKRASFFRSRFKLDENTKILDLGSESGANINFVLSGTDVVPENVYIADVDNNAIKKGADLYGFKPVLIGESETALPFEDEYFDIVFCSSVIEHVTIPKGELWDVWSGREFKDRSLRRQTVFSEEVARIGKQYFVQTPYKWFFLESHSWLPVIGWLPRAVQMSILKITNLFWIKKTQPDWYLLNTKEFSALFPGAEIVSEKSLGFTKSIMAVKKSDAI